MSVFVCVRIRSGEEIIKPWFARSVADIQKMLKELYDFKSSDMTVKVDKTKKNMSRLTQVND